MTGQTTPRRGRGRPRKDATSTQQASLPPADDLQKIPSSDISEEPQSLRDGSREDRNPEDLATEAPPPSKRVATERRQRRRRGSLGLEANMKLTVPDDYKDDRFEYRWIRNTPGRVRQLTVQDDYDIVEDEKITEEISDHMLQSGVGLVPERYGGTLKEGGHYNMVLVRKPREFYEEDQAAKAQDIDETERGIKEGAVRGGLTAGDRGYRPKAGISIEHGSGLPEQ